MQVFKHILFPTDLSQASRESLAYLLPMAAACQADLVILHTYRLIGQRESNSMTLKKELEAQATSIFSSWEDELLAQYEVSYRFISEIGFLKDRILSIAQKYPTDLAVVSERLLSELLGPEVRYSRGLPTLDFMPCALMIIPGQLIDAKNTLSSKESQSPRSTKLSKTAHD